MDQKGQGKKSDKFFIINMGVIVLVFLLALVYYFFKPEPPPQPISFSLQELKAVPAFGTPHMTAKVLFDAIKEKDISRIKPCLLTENKFNQFYNIEPSLFSNQNNNQTINSYQNYLDHIENKFQMMITELESLLETDSEVVLDSVSKGEMKFLQDIKIQENMEMYISIIGKDYSFKSMKIILPSMLKTFASYEVTQQSLEKLRTEGLPVDIIENLEGITNRTFSGNKNYMEILNKIIGEEQTAKYWEIILQVTKTMDGQYKLLV